ncbi:divalent metal cation transporter, partial [Staphylococcus pseudintermedius]
AEEGLVVQESHSALVLVIIALVGGCGGGEDTVAGAERISDAGVKGIDD